LTQHGNFSLRAAHDRAVRGNGTAVHIDSYPAARHKKAAAISGEKLVPAVGSVSSAMTLAAALRK